MEQENRSDEKVTRHFWPDVARGPWDIRLTWRLVAGRYECVGVQIEEVLEAEPTPPGAGCDWTYPSLPRVRVITPDVMHNRMRWGELFARARQEVARWDKQLASVIEDQRERRGRGEEYLPELADESPETVEHLRESAARFEAKGSGPGRKRQYADDHYREVARVWRDAWKNDQHPHPTKAVREHFSERQHTSKAQAAAWVRTARRLGFLGPAPPSAGGRGRRSRQTDTGGNA